MATSVPTPQSNPPDPQVPAATPPPPPGRPTTTTQNNPPDPQVPAATPPPPPGRPLLPLRDDGGSFNRQIGDVREDGAVLTQFLDNGTPVFVIRPAESTPAAVSPAVNPQVPPPPRALPNPAPGESRLVNTLEDFGTPIPPPPGFFENQRVRVRAPAAVAAVAVDPADITGNESAFVPTPPDPTATPGAVNPATNPQVAAAAAADPPAVAVPVTVNNPPDPTVPAVPGATVTAVTNLNEGRFRANDPAGYAQFQAYQKQRQAYETDRLTKAELARSGRTSLTAKQRADVNADAATLARNEAIRQFTPQIQAANAAIITTTVVPPVTPTTNSPGAVNPATDPQAREFTNNAGGAAIGIRRRNPAVEQAAGTANAQKQAPVQAQTSQPAKPDWRVRLKLAPQSKYLYNAEQPGILQPLKVTNGIIFPYTPQISTQYMANYSPYNLTHSNFKGYFYQGSNTGEVKINCPFTAQDTFEANYLLAVIHFFRSATKMFYGATDAFRGAPPPLVFLSGLGDYQFNNHACVIQSFDYTLPADVDYIRADTSNNTGTTLAQKRDRQNLPISSNNTSVNRLQNAGLYPGGIPVLPPPTQLGTESPTYVPTKMDISITLLPMQTRIQVSQQFSMEKFANGNLLKGGFW
jgi:hypothetical protein